MGRAGGAGDQDAPAGDAPPRKPRRRPASRLPRMGPRLVRGLVPQQGAEQACLVLEEVRVVRWHLEGRVVRLGLLLYFVQFVENRRCLVHGRGQRRGGGRRYRGPGQNDRGRPGIERRRRHHDVVGERVVVVVVQKKRGIANGRSRLLAARGGRLAIR
ncbi:hypothetical protein MRX96_053082 [Rhipicephalus microplus]